MAYLVFQFPTEVSAVDAIHAVANHFGVGVSVLGGAPNVPAHIKQAVESIGANNPANGAETSPALAFGGLLNGAAGNGQATPDNAQSSAAVATSMIVHGATPDISGTTPGASSAPAQPQGNGAVAHAASVATVSPAVNGVEFDSSGLAWDERIHSGNKTKTPGGEWRAKKGADRSVIKSVELELRAKYAGAAQGNGAASGAQTAGSAVIPASASQVDPAQRKAAALVFARAEALRVAGPQLIDDAQLESILNGATGYSLTPGQNEWFSVYYAKYQAAYKEFMSVPQPPASGANAATGSQMQTGDIPAAPLDPSLSAQSQTAAVTQPVVPVAPQGELDATGLPWDARIHLPAKIKDAAGVWVQRFDVGADIKLAVMGELRATLAGNAAALPSTDPAAAGNTPAVPTPPAVPILISAAEASADFTKMMQWIVANQLAKNISATAGPDAARDVGFAGADGNGQLVLMREHPAAWPYVVQLLQAQGAK